MFHNISLILVMQIFLINSVFLQPQYAQAPDTLWTKTFGGFHEDWGNSVQQTSDGGYIITGCTNSFGSGLCDVWLIKTDVSGDTLWTKTFGGIRNDIGYSVQQTIDGGYIITGTKGYFEGAGLSDVWLIKTDASGDTLWTKIFGGTWSDEGYSVQQTTDGGYIITGHTMSFGAGFYDVWLIKTNANGDTLWTKTFGGTNYDSGFSTQQTTDGGYIITGYTTSFGTGSSDVWLIKTNATGDTLWTNTFGGTRGDIGYSVQQTIDGGYVITGTKDYLESGVSDLWLIKTNATGDTLWTKTFSGNLECWGNSVQQTSDGGYIVTGYKDYRESPVCDLWLIKTDASGDTLWTKILSGIPCAGGNSVQQTTDGGYIITGFTSFSSPQEVWLIKIAPDPTNTDKDNSINVPGNYVLNQNYPNPFNSSTKISYSVSSSTFININVYDLLGKVIKTLVNDYKQAGDYSVNFDAGNLSSGVYFYKLKIDNNFVATQKMLLLR